MERFNHRRSEKIDYLKILTDASSVLGVYDRDVIYSLTPNELKALIKGARLHWVNEMESLSISAIWNARAQNEKRITAKKLFDAKKQREKIEKGDKPEKTFDSVLARERLKQARSDLKKYFSKKGG